MTNVLMKVVKHSAFFADQRNAVDKNRCRCDTIHSVGF